MDLGNFSVSLAVSDLKASETFYGHLGFPAIGGDRDQGWLIMKNDTTAIGLFQGMFEKNMLTFNPGWDGDRQPLPDYTDVRDIQKSLKASGAAFASEADESTTGPASCVVINPDGNPILIDQHV